MSRPILAVLAAMSLSGCAFHGVVPARPFTSGEQGERVPANVAYREKSSEVRPLHVAQGPTTYEIDLGDALDAALLSMLRSSFTAVSTQNDPGIELIVSPAFQARVKHLDGMGNAFIEATLHLTVVDARTRHVQARYAAERNISYSPPASATALQILTGASLFVLAPITIPAMVQLAGNEAVNRAEKVVPVLVADIQRQMLADRVVLARTRSIPTTSELAPPAADVKSVALARSKYDDILDCVVVIRTKDGRGSGFFVSGDGLVVTNAHVVGGDAHVSVRARSGATVFAEVIGLDKVRDLALLKTGISRTPWLSVAHFDEVGIGADVVAVGTPEGLDWSVSKGIVSAVREVDGVAVVQTDAAVNHGNSGGPLISIDSGRVVGVNSFGFRKEVAEGLNFAIAARELARAFPQIGH